jgi:hypothetical protein
VTNCWAINLKPELSQGDLLSLVLVGTATNPRTSLTRGQTKKQGVQSWDESVWKEAGDGIGHYLAKGRNANVIVLSQDCEIDKDDGKVPVLVAPVFPVRVFQSQDVLDAVIQRKRYPFLPLPEIQGIIEQSYVDLRCVTYIDRTLIANSRRMSSMSTEGIHELVKQIIAFFTHVPYDSLVVPVGNNDQ